MERSIRDQKAFTNRQTRADRPEPQIADNYDVFLSFHGYKLGLLTIGGFYKNIKDLIWEREGITVLNEDLTSGRFPADFRGTIVTQPENNVNDTKVRGLEIEWQTNFTWLPSPFDGIVLNANYSLIRTETRYPISLLRRTGLFSQVRIDTFRTGSMPDQSDDIANVAVGYDKDWFMVRLSWLYQGRTLSNVGAREEIDGYTDALQRWDMMVKFKVNTG
jgi:outer membrane receptor protein involved in Fe transport